MSKRKICSLSLLIAISVFFCSCGEKKEPPKFIRSIKTMKISKRSSFQKRKFSGLVYAVNYADLSFEDVSGRVTTINVDIGDEVKKDQILAILDKQKYELDVKNAKANKMKAEANLVKTSAEYEREKILFEKGASFQQRLDTREYQYKSAKSELNSKKAALGLALRNLRNTELKAPYNGFIGSRYIQPNQEVRKGEKIFQIDKKGDMEIQFKVPEGLRKRLKLEMLGKVHFPGFDDYKLKCSITYLGTTAGRGNAFPAKAVILDCPQSLKPGMTAEVAFDLPVEKSGEGFLVPPSAILIKQGKG